MPFIDGKRVSNDEWIEAKTGKPVDWMEVTGYQYGDEPTDTGSVESPEPAEDAAPAPKRRRRNTKAAAEKAISAATGVVVDLDEGVEEPAEVEPLPDAIDATLVDTSGIEDDPTSNDAEGN